MTSENKIVTRFAPSPTGNMHIGGVRTAFFAWAFARKNNGTFILRIEDTDKAREVPGSIEQIIASLKWVGIEWDEGIDIGGPNAPYLQSQRLDTYMKYAKILVEKGRAYADPYTEEEVEAFRQKSIAEKKPFLYRDYRPENPPVWDGTQPLRLKVTDIKSYTWEDAVRGTLSAGPEALDDLILFKSDGYPTYNFAHIIDDLLMGVTHIMRSDEFIASTPKFLSIYEALEIERPVFVMLPPIMSPDGKKKLGKRDGAKDALDYKAEGYLPEAIMNFLALIGWNPGGEREIFSPEELIQAFDISKIQHSGGGFNVDKLNWMNREHMKMLPVEKLEEGIIEFLPESVTGLPGYTREKLRLLVPVIVERIDKYSDVRTMAEAGELAFFFEAPTVDREKLVFKGATEAETKMHLEKAAEILTGISEEDWDMTMIKDRIMAYADTLPKRGPVLHPLRYSLSGLEKSPDPFLIAAIIGREETLARIARAV
jgi:glutamyl-tRNA synthetase